jgi:DNA-binding NarL/FixJ family response regulator
LKHVLHLAWECKTKLSATPVEHSNPEQQIRQVRALVADDFPSMQQALVNCLQTIPGVMVVGTASNGQEALQKSVDLKPDVVVADLLMPVMNGFQLFGKLRQSLPGIRLIAVSGHYSPVIEGEAIAAGADAFVTKSGLPADLVGTLQRLLFQ